MRGARYRAQARGGLCDVYPRLQQLLEELHRRSQRWAILLLCEKHRLHRCPLGLGGLYEYESPESGGPFYVRQGASTRSVRLLRVATRTGAPTSICQPSPCCQCAMGLRSDDSLTHSLTHPLTHSPTHSLTHPLTHSLTHVYTCTHPSAPLVVMFFPVLALALTFTSTAVPAIYYLEL